MVARLTPDQKVACSNHAVVTMFFRKFSTAFPVPTLVEEPTIDSLALKYFYLTAIIMVLESVS